MKKSLILTIIIVLINSCTVQKKEYYVFDRYTPKKVLRTDQVVEQSSPEITLAVPTESITPQALAREETMQSDVFLPRKKNKKETVYTERSGEAVNNTRQSTHLVMRTDIAATERATKEKERKNGDRFILVATALIGLSVLAAIRLMRPVTSKLTRWAKANPKKTQGLIAGIHLPLLGMGVMNGYSLDQMGYELSDPLLYGFGAAAVAGFAAAPYVRQQDWMVLPRTVNRNRLAFLGIVLSTLMLATGFGNKLERNYQNTYLASTVRSLDQTIFATSLTTETDSDNTTIIQAKEKDDRKAKAGMSAAGAFFLTFLLVLLACAGLCLVIGGISAIGTGTAGVIAAIVGGLALLYLSIKGIIKVSENRQAEKKREMDEMMKQQ
jgi:hypothetical protein